VPATVAFRGPATLVNALPDPYPVALPQALASIGDDEVEVRLKTPSRVRASVSTARMQLTPRAASPLPRRSRRPSSRNR
jgi:hypothetical protein